MSDPTLDAFLEWVERNYVAFTARRVRAIASRYLVAEQDQTRNSACQFQTEDGRVCGEPSYRVLDGDGYCAEHFRGEVDRRAASFAARHPHRNTHPALARVADRDATIHSTYNPAGGVTLGVLAREYGISKQRVSQILHAGEVPR